MWVWIVSCPYISNLSANLAGVTLKITPKSDCISDLRSGRRSPQLTYMTPTKPPRVSWLPPLPHRGLMSTQQPEFPSAPWLGTCLSPPPAQCPAMAPISLRLKAKVFTRTTQQGPPRSSFVASELISYCPFRLSHIAWSQELVGALLSMLEVKVLLAGWGHNHMPSSVGETETCVSRACGCNLGGEEVLEWRSKNCFGRCLWNCNFIPSIWKTVWQYLWSVTHTLFNTMFPLPEYTFSAP